MDDAKVIDVDDPVWDEVIRDLRHTFAHDRCYNMIMQSARGHRVRLFAGTVGGARLVLPFAERSNDTSMDAYTPFGWSGWAPDESADAWNLWDEFAERQGYVTSYFMTNPVLHPKPSPSIEGPWQMAHVLDLTKSLDELFAGLGQTHRACLRRLMVRDDLSIVFATQRLAEAFVALYQNFVVRTDVGSAYQFSNKILWSLTRNPSIYLVGVERAGRIEAVSLFGFSPHAVDYFLSAALPEGRDYARLIVWHAILRAKEKGIAFMNLGCGIRRGDGLDQFKSRFGGRETIVQVRRRVHDCKRFATLCHEAGVAEKTVGYFPPYHAPTTHLARTKDED